jgi:hypothetical protein
MESVEMTALCSMPGAGQVENTKSSKNFFFKVASSNIFECTFPLHVTLVSG